MRDFVEELNSFAQEDGYWLGGKTADAFYDFLRFLEELSAKEQPTTRTEGEAYPLKGGVFEERFPVGEYHEGLTKLARAIQEDVGIKLLTSPKTLRRIFGKG